MKAIRSNCKISFCVLVTVCDVPWRKKQNLVVALKGLIS